MPEQKQASQLIHFASRIPFGGYRSLCGDNGAYITLNGIIRRAYGGAQRSTKLDRVTCPDCLAVFSQKPKTGGL